MNKSVVAAAIGAGIAIAVVAALLSMPPSSLQPAEQDGIQDQDAPPLPPGEPGGQQAVPLQDDDKIVVFASFYPYYEFTRNVAGDRATVQQFIPQGVPAHDFEIQAREIESLLDASAFVYNGLGVDPYVENIIDSGEFDDLLFINTSEGIELIGFDEDSGDHAEEFADEVLHALEELEDGETTASEALGEIREIVDAHRDDPYDHGEDTIPAITAVLDEAEEGHIGQADAAEDIHDIVSRIHGDDEDAHDEDAHDEDAHDEDAHDEDAHDEDAHDEDAHDEDAHDEDAHDEDAHDEDAHGHGHGHDFEYDPHIWLDPVLVKEQVNNIRDGLIEADPGNAEHYAKNAQAYNQKLDELDAKIVSGLSSCNKNTFVPFHGAFAYLGERYGIDMMPLGGLAPDAEATATEIAGFVDFVRDNDIKVVFAEELIDPRLAEVIAEEAGARVMLLSPLEALAPEEEGQGVTYIFKMEQNLDALRVALECQ